MEDNKYVVIKKDDFEKGMEYIGSCMHHGSFIARRELPVVEDAVVIRLQDVFAEPALHSYASAISVAISAMRETVTILDGYPDVRSEVNEHVDRLQKVADYFHEAAEVAADHTHKKMPD